MKLFDLIFHLHLVNFLRAIKIINIRKRGLFLSNVKTQCKILTVVSLSLSLLKNVQNSKIGSNIFI